MKDIFNHPNSGAVVGHGQTTQVSVRKLHINVQPPLPSADSHSTAPGHQRVPVRRVRSQLPPTAASAEAHRRGSSESDAPRTTTDL